MVTSDKRQMCHVCLRKVRYAGRCHGCFHLICDSEECALAWHGNKHHPEDDSICKKCQVDKGHRSCHQDCIEGKGNILTEIVW